MPYMIYSTPPTGRLIASMLCCILVLSPAAATTGNDTEEAAEKCRQLIDADFASVEDAPTRLINVSFVEKGVDHPAYCRVRGYVASQVGFELKLPSDFWNEKLFGLGCGGFCGETEFFFHTVERWRPILIKGYAVFGTDMGHRGANAQDALWAYNNWQAEVDYAYRSTHVATLAVKTIVSAYYGQPAVRSYFWGTSTGGRQGLIEAERYPEDYDGVIVRCPVIDPTVRALLATAYLRAVREEGRPLLSADKIRKYATHVINQCDHMDGIVDGIIDDPLVCSIDPTTLVCSAERRTFCLGPQQTRAIGRLYRGVNDASSNETIVGGLMHGSELEWIGRYVTEGDSPSLLQGLVENYWRYSAFSADPGPELDLKDLEFDSSKFEFDYSRRLYAARPSGLTEYLLANRKIIMIVGWNDVVMPPMSAVTYYQEAEKTFEDIGNVRDNFRLFMLPGVGHCGHGGGSGADVIDDITALEEWVENNVSPEWLVAYRLKRYDGNSLSPQRLPPDPANVEFRRWIRPFPLQVSHTQPAINDRPDKKENRLMEQIH